MDETGKILNMAMGMYPDLDHEGVQLWSGEDSDLSFMEISRPGGAESLSGSVSADNPEDLLKFFDF